MNTCMWKLETTNYKWLLNKMLYDKYAKYVHQECDHAFMFRIK